MTPERSKADKLRTIIRAQPKALVAFSGGVDSTLLLKVCRDILGPANVTAVTGVSQTYTPEEKRTARRVARELGVQHVLIETDELACAAFARNPADRCYHCKRELYRKLAVVARRVGAGAVLDGTIVDDLGDWRPGRRAAAEHAVRSPLAELGFTKADVRAAAAGYVLASTEKPASPCLASRIPYGTEITREALQMVERAEELLRALGFGELRVRHHGDTARIEVPLADLERLLAREMRERVVAELKALDYRFVAVDLEGFRSGSLNAALGRGAGPDRAGGGAVPGGG
jgi:uncharacterized protein